MVYYIVSEFFRESSPDTNDELLPHLKGDTLYETFRKSSRLGTDQHSLRRFAVPSVIAMLVSALYNMVDQLFIGHSIGVLGNAATNVAFPLSMVCTSIGLLCGIGGAANFNLCMGRKDPEHAKSYVGNAISMLAILGVILCVAVQLFLRPMMLLFGATPDVIDYACTYTRITSIGFPFLIITIGGSNLIRAMAARNFPCCVT